MDIPINFYHTLFEKWFNKPIEETEKVQKLLIEVFTEYSQLALAISQINTGVIITDPNQHDNPVIYANPGFSKLTGYTINEITGKNCRFLTGKDTDPNTREKIRNAIANHKEITTEILNYKKDGTPFWNELKITPVFNKEQELVFFIGLQSDITKRKEAENTIRHMVYHDHLTHLPNRVYFLEKLEETLKDKENLSILLLDLNRFKLINDTKGHAVGDKLLKIIANRISNSTPENTLAARLGGDEFIILIPNIANKEEVILIAKEILKQISLPITLDNGEIVITASMGISFKEETVINANELIRNADIAMYNAKEMGGAYYYIYDEELVQPYESKFYIEQDLKKAIKNKEFFLEYQPIVDLKTQNIASLEALIRWKHPIYGLISPSYFIPLAEGIGIINEIGDWVLKTVIQQMKTWKDKFVPVVPIAINFSAKQFLHNRMIKKLEMLLMEENISPHFIQLEMTETFMMKNLESSINILKQLNFLGIQTAIDDFGTGYSSLNYLRTLPIKTLKIDKSFIQDPNNLTNLEIVKIIITLAKTLNLKVVAEGVETIEILDFLKENHCDYAQGYYISKPLSVTEIARFLKTKNGKQT